MQVSIHSLHLVNSNYDWTLSCILMILPRSPKTEFQLYLKALKGEILSINNPVATQENLDGTILEQLAQGKVGVWLFSAAVISALVFSDYLSELFLPLNSAVKTW